MNDEYICEECEAEFRILHDHHIDPIYCPFCRCDSLKNSNEEQEDEDNE